MKTRTDALVKSGDAIIQSILTDTTEFRLYTKLTSLPDNGHSIIGKGEAAAIALASTKKSIIASNNLKDVAQYVSELGLRHITTGDILKRALEVSLITESDGNNIWNAMHAKRRKIGAVSFTDYLSSG